MTLVEKIRTTILVVSEVKMNEKLKIPLWRKRLLKRFFCGPLSPFLSKDGYLLSWGSIPRSLKIKIRQYLPGTVCCPMFFHHSHSSVFELILSGRSFVALTILCLKDSGCWCIARCGNNVVVSFTYEGYTYKPVWPQYQISTAVGLHAQG